MRSISQNPSFYVDPSRMTDCRKTREYLEATVLGTDTYQVKAHPKKEGGGYCSCPAFRNFDGDCKHIAAVALAYQKHPEWFKKSERITNAFQDLPREKLIKVLTLVFDSVPEARDIIEGELSDKTRRGIEYQGKIKKSFSSCSGDEHSIRNLHSKLGSFFQIAKESFRSGSHFECLGICYEIVHGCLSLDHQWGSTEIFPEGWVSEVWELYVKTLAKAELSETETITIKTQIKKLHKFESYLYDQEGVYPEEAEEVLEKK